MRVAVGIERVLRDAQRLGRADDAGDVLGAGAALALLAAAVLLREERHAAADVQHAHALRPAELVRRQAQQVDVRASATSSRSEFGACTASVWNGMRFFIDAARSRTAAAISAIGSIVPTSLFAVMMLTSTVCVGDRARDVVR